MARRAVEHYYFLFHYKIQVELPRVVLVRRMRYRSVMWQVYLTCFDSRVQFDGMVEDRQ